MDSILANLPEHAPASAGSDTAVIRIDIAGGAYLFQLSDAAIAAQFAALLQPPGRDSRPS